MSLVNTDVFSTVLLYGIGSGELDCKDIIEINGTIVPTHRLRDGKELRQSLKYKTKQKDISYGMYISQSALDDAGEYTVHAKNSYGEITHTAKMNITRKCIYITVIL